jgi:hypothetical protein
MSDDEADPELIELLRQALLGPSKRTAVVSTGVLKSAEYIYGNAIDVFISSTHTKQLAQNLLEPLRSYSTHAWSEHALHPKSKDEAAVNFIFTIDLLNFSFWSETEEGYTVNYRDQDWSGDWGMVAALQRALDEGASVSAWTS